MRSARASSTRPATCPQRVAKRREARGRTATDARGRADSDGTPRSPARLSRKKEGYSSPSRNGITSAPLLLSARPDALSGAGGAGSARPAAARSQRQGGPAGSGALLKRPETPASRATIAGAAAIVAGGRIAPDEAATQATDKTALGTRGRNSGSYGDVSPRTAKKVLPHFLAIGNPGSQALVAKEGAEIVQKQVRSCSKRPTLATTPSWAKKT